MDPALSDAGAEALKREERRYRKKFSGCGAVS